MISADVILWRPPEPLWDLMFITSAEHTRYIPGSEVTGETTAFSQFQAKRDLGEMWRFNLSLQYLFFDQVLDNSDLDQLFSTLQLQGHNLAIQPSVRREAVNGTFVEAGYTLSRQFYQSVVDDEWQLGPRFSIGKSYGNRSEVSLGLQFQERKFDDRQPRSADGLSTIQDSLKYQQLETSLVWNHHWDGQRRWRTSTRLGFLRNNDNYSGYYDYDRFRLTEQLRYRVKGFQFLGELKLSHYEYALQHAGPTDPAQRRRTMSYFTIRAEKSLRDHLTLFAEYSHERSLSNLRSDAYKANAVSAGIELEF